MLIRQKRHCPTCNKEVDIMNLEPHGEGHFRQVLSCGHTFKFVDVHLNETISITDMVEGKVIKVRTLQEGGVPVALSGSSGITKVASFSGLQGVINNTGQLIIDKLIINQITNQTIDASTTTTNILNDILIQVENSPNLPDDKEKIKEILKIIDKEKSKSIPEINSALSHLKSWIPIATPFITPYLASLFK